MSVQGQPVEIRRRFDPGVRDCFAPLINATDVEVDELLAKVSTILGTQGEYDQEDIAVLRWDDARDLWQIASTLWKARAGIGLGEPEPAAERPSFGAADLDDFGR